MIQNSLIINKQHVSGVSIPIPPNTQKILSINKIHITLFYVPEKSLHPKDTYYGSWFIQALGGLIPTSPGYRTVTIDPQIPEGREWVRLKKETPYGEINIECTIADGARRINVSIPVGITATIDGK